MQKRTVRRQPTEILLRTFLQTVRKKNCRDEEEEPNKLTSTPLNGSTTTEQFPRRNPATENYESSRTGSLRKCWSRLQIYAARRLSDDAALKNLTHQTICLQQGNIDSNAEDSNERDSGR